MTSGNSDASVLPRGEPSASRSAQECAPSAHAVDGFLPPPSPAPMSNAPAFALDSSCPTAAGCRGSTWPAAALLLARTLPETDSSCETTPYRAHCNCARSRSDSLPLERFALHPCAARSNSAMSSFFIFIIACMALECLTSSPMRRGTTCQLRPNLSVSNPHWISLPPSAVNLDQ